MFCDFATAFDVTVARAARRGVDYVVFEFTGTHPWAGRFGSCPAHWAHPALSAVVNVPARLARASVG